jgi:hypothetical protein
LFAAAASDYSVLSIDLPRRPRIRFPDEIDITTLSRSRDIAEFTISHVISERDIEAIIDDDAAAHYITIRLLANANYALR